jgi:hypothetical protein
VASSFSASLSLKALSLASKPDLALQDGRLYHVTVTLATQGGGGEMDFTSTSSEGGTYTSSFVVTPIFTLTNVKNSSDVQTINCLTNTTVSCSFSMHGGGNWVLSSNTGFDPQSQGIPTVPSGVTLGGYTTVGRNRFGGIQVGCGGTKSTGYSCGGPNQGDEQHGILGQAAGHTVQPPNDCSAPPPPQPSPTPVATGGGGGCAVTTTGVGCSTRSIAMVTTGGGGGGPSPSPSPTPLPSPTPQPLCSN